MHFSIRDKIIIFDACYLIEHKRSVIFVLSMLSSLKTKTKAMGIFITRDVFIVDVPIENDFFVYSGGKNNFTLLTFHDKKPLCYFLRPIGML